MTLFLYSYKYSKTNIKNYSITNNFEEANILLNSLYDISIVNNKKWQLKIHYSGESREREKYCFYYADYNNYDIILRGCPSQKNIIDLPGFACYIQCNHLYERLIHKPIIEKIPEKFCCFVVTNWGTECRNKMFEILNQYKKVDSAGKYQNNIGYKLDGSYWDKKTIDFISQYKFMICFENTKEDNYITEKIINPFLAGTIPIYWGTEYCKTVFNHNSFLYWDNNRDENYENIIEEIKRLDQDDEAYLKMRNQQIFNKDFNFHETYGYDTIASQINKLITTDLNSTNGTNDTAVNNTIIYNNIDLIPSPLFYTSNKDTYPPFKKGLYLEEYFLEYMKKHNIQKTNGGRLYIPALWTNFQIENWFYNKKYDMHQIIHSYYSSHYNHNGYIAIVQHDHGTELGLPENSIICGSCAGDIPLPLIYQDIDNKLEQFPKKQFQEKEILCSFIGTTTHNVRGRMIEKIKNNSNFSIITNSNWTANVEQNKQDKFIQTTLTSKFALAPRGYGRSSFRFFEIFKLGSIPIYIWDDREWLPYKDVIDYSKICISIHIDELDTLEERLLNINEDQYNQMIQEYNNIKHMFDLEYMCEYIIQRF